MSDEIRQKAKALKIKNWHNKKIENLEKEIAAIDNPEQPRELFKPKEPEQPKLEVKIDTAGYNQLKSMGVKDEWLVKIARQYNFTKLEYMDKFKSFRCYIGNKCVDWVSVNDLSADNGGGKLVEIINKTRPIDSKKRVIKFAWRV
jgi:hypothetical protein